MLRMLTCIACLSGLSLTTGHATAAELFEQPDRYEIELIIFRHVDQSRNTPEIPAATSIFRSSPLDLTLAEIPMQPPLPAPPLAFSAITPDDSIRRPPISFYITPLQPEYPDFVPLRDTTHELGQVYANLEQVDAYEPLIHVGWVQQARESDNALTYHLPPEIIGDHSIAGTVTLYKNRYLHLDIDLALETAGQQVRSHSLFGPRASEPPEVYKLTESRRIRGTTAHYFDHPQFGLITRIREVRAAANARKEQG